LFSQVGQVDGDEVVAATSDALPRDAQQGGVPRITAVATQRAWYLPLGRHFPPQHRI